MRRIPEALRDSKAGVVAFVVSLAVATVLAAAAGAAPGAQAAATCSDYETQADAQRAADTHDPDGDGRYCV